MKFLLVGLAVCLAVLVGVGIVLDGVPGLVCVGVGLVGLAFLGQELLLRADLPGRLRRRRQARRPAAEQSRQVAQLREDLQGLGIPETTVRRQHLPARTVVMRTATGAGTARASALEQLLRDELLPALRRQGIVVTGPPGIFLVEPGLPDPAVTAWLPVAAGTSTAAPLEARQLPEQFFVVVRERGSGIEVESGIAEAERFAREQGLTLAVPTAGDPASMPFLRFVGGPAADFASEAGSVGGAGVSIESEFTELCWPVGARR